MRSTTFVCSTVLIGLLLFEYACAQETSARAIYRCEADGVITFSDRPCAPNAEVHDLDAGVLNTFESPPSQASAQRAAPKAKATKGSSTPTRDSDKHKQTCERLAQGLKDIRAKQRSGYTASEGERLKERQAKLKSQLRMARCG